MQLAAMPSMMYNSEMVTAAQLRAARALLDWSQQQVADAASTSRNTILGIERGTLDPRASTLQRVVEAFQKAGVEFTSDAQHESVRRLKQWRQERERGDKK